MRDMVGDALSLIGEEALPLMPQDAFPDEKSWQRHRVLHTLIRLARLVNLGAPADVLVIDMALVRRRLDDLCGPLDEWLGPAPEVPGRRDLEGPLPCLNCADAATEERDEGIPVCAACGAAWDRGEWGAELR
jgi:hypothetical protein